MLCPSYIKAKEVVGRPMSHPTPSTRISFIHIFSQMRFFVAMFFFFMAVEFPYKVLLTYGNAGDPAQIPQLPHPPSSASEFQVNGDGIKLALKPAARWRI